MEITDSLIFKYRDFMLSFISDDSKTKYSEDMLYNISIADIQSYADVMNTIPMLIVHAFFTDLNLKHQKIIIPLSVENDNIICQSYRVEECDSIE